MVEKNAPPTQGSYILYGEDNPTDALFFKRTLSNTTSPAEFVHLKSGSEVVDHLNTILEGAGPLPGLIILDIKMPGMTGLQVLEYIREHERLRLLPVIMLSASYEDRDIEMAYDNRANAYLVKPSQYKSLEKLVDSIVTFWITHNRIVA